MTHPFWWIYAVAESKIDWCLEAAMSLFIYCMNKSLEASWSFDTPIFVSFFFYFAQDAHSQCAKLHTSSFFYSMRAAILAIHTICNNSVVRETTINKMLQRNIFECSIKCMKNNKCCYATRMRRRIVLATLNVCIKGRSHLKFINETITTTTAEPSNKIRIRRGPYFSLGVGTTMRGLMHIKWAL